MPSAFGDLNGNGPQQVWIDVARIGQDWGANRTDYRGEVRYYGNGWGSWGGDWGWEANFGGFGVGGRFSIPSSQRNQQFHTLWSGTFSRYHDGEGWLGGFYCSAWIDTDHSSVGDGGANTTEEAPPRIPQLPAAPNSLSVNAVLPTSFGVNYARGDNRGAGIEQDRAHWYEGGPAGSGTFVWEDLNPAGYTNPAGGAGPSLKPGTRHYVYVSSRNARGWGPWAGPIDAETLAGGRAWDGSVMRNCRVRYWDGSQWRLCRVRAWDGSAWRNVR